jgi:hypothetical protein
MKIRYEVFLYFERLGHMHENMLYEQWRVN